MRSFLAGLVVVGLLVARAFGDPTIDIELRVNGVAGPATLNWGQLATVEGWFKCTGAGLCAIAGDITASGPAGALSVVGTPLAASTFFVPEFETYPTTPVAGANGAVGTIASAQTNLFAPGYAVGAFVKVFSYTVLAGIGGTVTLNWQEAPAGGYNALFTLDVSGNAGIATNTGVAITVPYQMSPPIGSSVDYSVAGKKTFWRTKKNIVRLTFSGALLAAPAAGQIKIQECLDGGAYGPDLSSNFGFKLESNNTVVRIIDNSTNGVLLNHHWYCVRTESGSWPGMADFKKLTPVLVGDYDGNGVLSAAGDVNPIVAKLAAPSVAPNDADRRDVDGNMVISAAGDVNPAVAGLSVPVLLRKPTGH